MRLLRLEGMTRASKRVVNVRKRQITRQECLLTTLTRDTAQQMQGRRVWTTLVQHALLGGPGQRNRQRDWSVKFPPSRFHRYDWTNGHAVA